MPCPDGPEKANSMILEVAAGILIATGILAITALGLTVALDRDNRAIGASGPGWLIACVGGILGVAVIYMAI